MRDGDRNAHRQIGEVVVGTSRRWLRDGAPPRDAVSIVVDRFLKPTSDLAISRASPGFVAAVGELAIGMVTHLPVASVDAGPLIDLSLSIDTTLILQGNDASAGDVIAAQWNVVGAILAREQPPSQIAVQLLNTMGNGGQFTMTLARATTMKATSAVLATSVDLYSQAIRSWRVRAMDCLRRTSPQYHPRDAIPSLHPWITFVFVAVINGVRPLIQRIREGPAFADEMRDVLLGLTLAVPALPDEAGRPILFELYDPDRDVLDNSDVEMTDVRWEARQLLGVVWGQALACG
jgi:hypothetical protein